MRSANCIGWGQTTQAVFSSIWTHFSPLCFNFYSYLPISFFLSLGFRRCQSWLCWRPDPQILLPQLVRSPFLLILHQHHTADIQSDSIQGICVVFMTLLCSTVCVIQCGPSQACACNGRSPGGGPLHRTQSRGRLHTIGLHTHTHTHYEWACLNKPLSNPSLTPSPLRSTEGCCQ